MENYKGNIFFKNTTNLELFKECRILLASSNVVLGTAEIFGEEEYKQLKDVDLSKLKKVENLCKHEYIKRKVQTRSGDEAMTIIYLCTLCNYSYTEN